MQWLNDVIDNIVTQFPGGELLIESGASPSGTYHVGHLREVVTCDALVLELRRRGREARHIHFVDDLDGFRKIPINLPTDYEQYLGQPLCDIPAPNDAGGSLGDYFLAGFLQSIHALGIELEVIYSHEKYRSGFFVPTIERALQRIDTARTVLEVISQRKLDEHWSPVQIMENGRLKNRRFISIDTHAKTIQYEDANGDSQTVPYNNGAVKLDWRLDWPGRWWLLHVQAEPFGRDHATKGGSYDTGAEIMRQIYDAEPPIPVPYDFINRAGDTKKMSASKGTGIDATEMIKVLPAEVVRFFMLRYSPAKRLYFDQADGVINLVDEFAELAAKPDKSESEQQLLYLCTRGAALKAISRIPFSHLVASYQAALKNVDKTLEIIGRTEYADVAKQDDDVIKNELQFIDEWLKHWAPETIKFNLLQHMNPNDFNDKEQKFLHELGDKIAAAPDNADGQWFHQTIYAFKDSGELSPSQMFSALYRVLINKQSGPRAGWFLNMLPRDWLIKRLRLEA